MPVPFSELLLSMVVVAIAASVQGTVGIGFNVVAVPTLLLIDPLLAPVPNLLRAAPLVVSQALREHTRIDRSGVKWILLGRVPGGLLGLWILLALDTRAINVFLGILILTIVALLASGVSIARNPATELTGGVFSGVAGIVGAVGGPPVGLLYKDAPPPVVRSTLGVVFSVGLVISIGLRALGGRITTTDIQISLWLAPAMAVGFAASGLLKDRVDEVIVRRSILVVSTVASLTLLIRTIAG